MLLDGKVALVTGASRGIGRAIAIRLAAEGAKVAINFAGNTEKAEAVKAEIEAAGGEALLVQANVADAAAVEEMVAKVVEAFGGIDVLVNNAGITRDGLLVRMKDEDFDAVLDTNLKGVFYCTKVVSKLMMKKRSGRIVNMTSVVGVNGNAGQTNYAAAKAGVIGFTKTIARELASRGITANAVAPGFIQSKMTDILPDDVKKAYMDTIPLKRFGTAEDIAKCVAFLAGPDADYITGQIISVNGGMIG